MRYIVAYKLKFKLPMSLVKGMGDREVFEKYANCITETRKKEMKLYISCYTYNTVGERCV